MTPSLLSIIAHARAGGLDHALRLFQEAGLGAVTDDAAVLSLKGRLLKDQGRRASGEERRLFYGRSAEAYRTAGALSGATYPLINAASLSLLAGEPARAAALAETVLARLDQGDAEPDTPYWREATRAEVELLLGRTSEARATLRAAVALAPRAWEDHASTLRQFALILEAQGQPADWLETFRPPRALHFAGHLGIDPDDTTLAGRVATILDTENVGFGYGALAAGADIVVAEALLARGSELHLVLPGSRTAFRAVSVEPLGEGWGDRFDALIDKAETVSVLPGLTGRPDPLSLRLACQAAMGRAAMQARLLASEAIQLTVPDDADESAVFTAWARELWTNSGRRALTLAAPRSRAVPQAAILDTPGDALIVAALVISPPTGSADAMAESLLKDLASAGAVPAQMPVWTGQALLLAFETCEQAAAAARIASITLGEGRIAGAAGVGRRVQGMLMGRPPATAARLLASVPPGAALVDATFASLLAAGSDGESVPCEPVGELPPAGEDRLGDDIDRGVYSLNL